MKNDFKIGCNLSETTRRKNHQEKEKKKAGNWDTKPGITKPKQA